MEIVLTPDEMRAADAATIGAGTPGFVLMDRAAYACAVVALRMLGGAYGKRVVVVCGKGNNGGDGIACARHLTDRGVHVTVLLLGEPTGDPADHLKLLRNVSVDKWSLEKFRQEADRSDLVVDAVFGTGFSGEPKGDAADAIAAINDAAVRVLAVDVPSGFAVNADVTVAIQALKLGHVTMPGAVHCGRVDVCEIGIDVPDAHTFVPQAHDVVRVLPEAEPDTHKYSVGALGVIAGSVGMTGAAILTARGAIRAGAGLVILGVPASTLEVFEGAVIEAIKVPLPEAEGQLEAKAVDEFADRLERCRALAIGPGLGRGPRAVAVTRRALDVMLPLICDGDGLWALSEIMRDEPEILKQRAVPTILTPHGGEFAFLTGHAPGPDRVNEVRSVAKEWGAVVHLKGRRAVTGSPDGDVWVNTTGNPGAATGGTGDVLTGIVSSLVAQGAQPSDATWAGAYLHGLAADIVASRSGERSLQADDLPEALPRAFSELRRTKAADAPLRTVVENAR